MIFTKRLKWKCIRWQGRNRIACVLEQRPSVEVKSTLKTELRDMGIFRSRHLSEAKVSPELGKDSVNFTLLVNCNLYPNYCDKPAYKTECAYVRLCQQLVEKWKIQSLNCLVCVISTWHPASMEINRPFKIILNVWEHRRPLLDYTVLASSSPSIYTQLRVDLSLSKADAQ